MTDYNSSRHPESTASGVLSSDRPAEAGLAGHMASYLGDVLQKRFSRRAAVAGSAGVAAAGIGTSSLIPSIANGASGIDALGFDSLPQPYGGDDILVADGHEAQVVLRWGDPILANAPAFDPLNQTAAAQERQFGFNCDFTAFFPLPSTGAAGSGDVQRGLLAVNHEYTDGVTMFPGYDSSAPTREQVDIELAAHGLSVVEIVRTDGVWKVVIDSPYNRRITATTKMELTGPAAGAAGLRTGADPAGRWVLGMLNNCGGGKTPWGTVLTAEENFNQYFGNLDQVDPQSFNHKSYKRAGIGGGATGRKWERYHSRFDLGQEPQEANRFGYIVEIDPYDPDFVPRKRTALGRFAHEAATIVIGHSGKVVAYSGDDSRYEYIFKFVSDGTYVPADRASNLKLLDSGTLHVAKLFEDGTGQWLPMIWGQGKLTPANGFNSPADVLIHTRLAADLMGATKMDRPEDIETNPVNGKVYVALTNNTSRKPEEVDGPNPRPNNKFGHILELTALDDDHEADVFAWEIFMLCGDPQSADTYFGGFDKDAVCAIGNPDNIAFDSRGNLWISTDGQPGSMANNDGVFVVPTAGPDRGHLKQFMAAVIGAEVCGPELTPDNRTLFAAIQHPGEGGTFAAPASHWPDGGSSIPRPSVVAIQESSGKQVGRPV